MALRVHFFQPPPEQRVGGLEAAVESLRRALPAAGVEVHDGPGEGQAPTLVHFHGLWQPAHARASRGYRECGSPYVVSPHGMLEPWAWRHKWWKKWPYFHLVEKRHLARAAAVLATGPGEAGRLRRFLPQTRIEALPLGLTGEARPDYKAARQRLGWAAEEIVLLYLSRLHVKKGADLLLRALAGLRCPAVTRVVFVGDGDRAYVERLRRFATDHAGELPRLDWVGAVWGEERWKYFQGADLFCLPTHSENFGLAVLEALQVGTPVLTTRETPWSEELGDGRGYVSTPQVERLREDLRRFFASARTTPGNRAAMADWARARFAWPSLAPRYAEFYRSLLADRR